MKTNCWEQKSCGREAGGKNAAALGICPATTEIRLNDVHGGKNAGRACWTIKNTLCGGQVQGSYGDKFKNCQQCDFYKQVRQEEGLNYINSVILLDRIKISPSQARP